MDIFLKAIDKNPFGKSCVPAFTKDKVSLVSKGGLWGAERIRLLPSRLITAWLMLEDPLMRIAGEGYRAGEVRNKSFEIQAEAVANLRGNRKLTKAKMGDALSALQPTEDQTKIIAAVLLATKQVQTVCFDEEKKTVWTVPEDLRAWSRGRKTLWVSGPHCDTALEWASGLEPSLGKWLSDREDEGWKIGWPIAEGTMEEMKKLVTERGIQPKPAEFGAKVKKEDWARTLGRCQAVEHLGL
uniref:Uncharacterized protein n=1 Tax=viral metagenome TaxID=1070528 RepID=A0A6C0KNX6_9ZZZZ